MRYDKLNVFDMSNAHYPSDIAALKAHAAEIVALRKRKSFRRRLMLSRFNREVLHGNAASRRDFFAFIKAKLGKEAGPSRPLSDFDPTNGEEKRTAQALIERYASSSVRSEKRQLLIFSYLQYYVSGGGQRGAQLAKAFTELGFDVLYLYAGDNYYSFDLDFIDDVAIHLPVRYFGVQQLTDLLNEDSVVVIEHPHGAFLPYFRALKDKGVKMVYEQIDNWETELGETWYNRENYSAFLNGADVLTASARNLCDMVSADCGRCAAYIPNAVNTAVFDPDKEYSVPYDMPLGRKTLLYFGHSAGNWLDWDLLYDTAELCPDCSFVIIAYGHPQTKRARPANVHLLGEKPQPELPAYLAASDFALLHFKTGEVGIYVSPIKVFEYLAMRKPVLATPLPDIIGYPNVICSGDPRVWAETIKNPPELVPFDDFVNDNSWLARCRAILAEVDKK